jgi:lipoate-protein ligase A
MMLRPLENRCCVGSNRDTDKTNACLPEKMSERVGRLLTFRRGSPAENMALDESILRSVDDGGLPTLRFYGWSEPTLSLGCFQRVGDRSLHTDSESLPCVRRATGGGAIVHDRELTFSIAVPQSDRRPGARDTLYRETHAAVAETLMRFGVGAVPFRSTGAESVVAGQPFLCFQRRTAEDLVVAGYKVLGSAQRTSRHAVLQHGSLLVGCSRSAPQLPGIWELSGIPLTATEVAEALTDAFGRVLGIGRWRKEGITDPERRRAESLREKRYGNPDWLNRR